MNKTILLTGATGYIGGRLLTRLQKLKYPVKCLTRRPEALKHKLISTSSVHKGDVQDPETLIPAMSGVDTALYLIHSMADSDNFEEADRKAAINFANAARKCGVKKIIYVGGLGDSAKQLSAHLRSRQEVGKILAKSDAQILEFRASIVIGSGSLSFELVRSLVDRLPIMIMPKWVQVKAQPIWINDLLLYLERAIDYNNSGNHVFQIGGTDIVSYREIMEAYAKQKNLKRVMINVPVLTPYLSSLWLGLVTPIFARTGRKLVESLRHPTIVKDSSAENIFNVQPVGLSKAIKYSIANEDHEYAETRWADALSSSGIQIKNGGAKYGRRLIDCRSIKVKGTREEIFKKIEKLGGENGWKPMNWAWKARGAIDLLAGGVGIRRGRPHPEQLHTGDTLDWWRVERITRPETLLLRAEMKLPGRAWLKFEVQNSKEDSGIVEITQTAIFDPKGLGGQLYWYSLVPIHYFIFNGMLKALVT